ncbi:hypothetical protein V8E36_009812 [Tilletia maclaganii]
MSGSPPARSQRLPPPAGAAATLHAASDLSDAALGWSSPSRPPGQFSLSTRDIHFTDAYGRAVQLHGVNVSGSSKIPSAFLDKKNGNGHKDGGGGGDGIPTFVDRPFPLDEADYHLSRLQAWGLTTLRLLVTWEALQPSSPQHIDSAYLTYLQSLLRLLPRYGLRVFICAHQDVWSRATGGSGAPGWTCELVGLEGRAFGRTGAAYVHEEVLREQERERRAGKGDPRERVGPFVWPSGYQKLAAATMATVFWAGDIFAHKVRVPRSWTPPGSSASFDSPQQKQGEEMVGLQTFLQDAYLRAYGALADAVGGMEGVLGFDVMNEPHRGFINLHSFSEWDYDTDLHIGFFPSFLQSVALGEGHAQLVPFYVKSFPFPTKLSHYSLIQPPPPTPDSPALWRADGPTRGQCLWRMHDVWAWDEGRPPTDFRLWESLALRGANLRGHRRLGEAVKGKPVALRRDYFEYDPRISDDDAKGTSSVARPRRRIEWYRDCYAPFVSKFADRIRAHHPHLHIFFEAIPNEFIPPWLGGDGRSPQNQDKSIEERNRDADELEVPEHAARAQTYSHASSRVLIDTPRPQGSVFAPHFYDLNVLFNKASGPMSVNVQGLSRGMFFARALYFGARGAYRNYQTQISNLISHAHLSLGRGPTLIGEIGIPFDINDTHAFRTGDYRVHSRLLDALLAGMEARFASFTLWNYCPINTIEDGDLWNGEDFSLMTVSPGAAQDRRNVERLRVKRSGGKEEEEEEQQRRRLYELGRCLDAVIRPYGVKIAGVPIWTGWDRETGEFELVWANSASWPLSSGGGKDGAAAALSDSQAEVDRTRLTEIFWPKYHYEGEKVVLGHLSDGEWWIDEEKQSLYVLHSDLRPGFKHSVYLRIEGRPRRLHSRDKSRSVDVVVVGLVLGVLAVLLYAVDGMVKEHASGGLRRL